MELKQKGSSAQIGAFSQLKVSLIWTAAVDLDLMAFYKTKDGRVGGVYSENYAGGSKGDLNRFPYMALSDDAGVGAVGGDNREEMLIAGLDELSELYLCALNFTDAVHGGGGSFAPVNARVEIQTDRGETHAAYLAADQPGSVAVIARVTSGFLGPQINNDSNVMDFNTFKTTLPGASALRLESKITLKEKGDSHSFQIKQKDAGQHILINLNWNRSGSNPPKKGLLNRFLGGNGHDIDLDLGCYYELNPGRGTRQSVIDGLQFSNQGGPRNRVTRQGCYTQAPWIWHMGDDRSGSHSAEGESILINPQGFGDIKRMTLYAFIYEGAAKWSETDAVATIQAPGAPKIVVEMGRQNDSRTFCALAGLDFSGDGHIRVTKHMTFHNGHGDCDKAYKWNMKWQAGAK